MISQVNIEDLSKKLRRKERELQPDLARLKEEARATGEPEVRDATDDAAADESSAIAFEEASMESRTLEQVQDALKRMENGTYGNCTDCGRPIPPARLAAIPWTPYCIEDQQKHDGSGESEL